MKTSSRRSSPEARKRLVGIGVGHNLDAQASAPTTHTCSPMTIGRWPSRCRARPRRRVSPCSKSAELHGRTPHRRASAIRRNASQPSTWPRCRRLRSSRRGSCSALTVKSSSSSLRAIIGLRADAELLEAVGAVDPPGCAAVVEPYLGLVVAFYRDTDTAETVELRAHLTDLGHQESSFQMTRLAPSGLFVRSPGNAQGAGVLAELRMKTVVAADLWLLPSLQLQGVEHLLRRDPVGSAGPRPDRRA